MLNRSVRTISPDLAAELSGCELAQPAYVAAAGDPARRRDAAGGVGAETRETIKIAADGTLLDGQHRLQAVVDSEVTIEKPGDGGMPLAAQDSLSAHRGDAADSRTSSRSKGRPIRMRLRRVVQDATPLRLEREAIAVRHAARHRRNKRTGARSNAEPQLRDGVREARRAIKHTRGRSEPPRLFTVSSCEVDKEATEDFFARLADGVGLAKGDPVLHLGNQLQRPGAGAALRAVPLYGRGTHDQEAFNLRRAGRSVDLLASQKDREVPSDRRGGRPGGRKWPNSTLKSLKLQN